MTNYIEKFKELYDFEIETGFKYHQELKERYFELLKEAKDTGLFPFVIVLSEGLFEIFEIALDAYDLELTKKNLVRYREIILDEYKDIDIYDLFETFKDDFKMEIKKLEKDGKWDKNFKVPVIDDDRSEFEFMTVFDKEEFDNSSDFANKEILPDTIIVKIPMERPYEVFAYLPMGEFNDAPCISEMITVSKHWYNKYSAFPAAISSDELDYFVGKPVCDDEEVRKLAVEHLLFAFSMALNGYNLEEIARSFKNNVQWYFYF